MKITFIHHSCFLVESQSAQLLFDYFEGDLPPLDPRKMLYIFASHRHGDHFSPHVFSLAERHPKVHIFLSNDIDKTSVFPSLLTSTTFCAPHHTYTHEGIQIETLRSTDEGVAFWLTLDGNTLYHAGDLNDWQWEGEDPAWNTQMQARYRKEIDRLQGRHVDVAFLPLDPRQEAWYALGVEYFLQQVTASQLFPMHCWDNFSVISRFQSTHPDYPITSIAARGDQFNF